MAPHRLALLQFCACVALTSCAYVVQPPTMRRTRTAARWPELASADLPTSPKATAESLSLAVQAALADGARRLEIALPAGVRFSEGSKQTLGTQSTTASERAMGDLELACLLVEVFQNERDACCVVLPDAKAVTAANRAWKWHGLHAAHRDALGARQGPQGRRRLRRQGRRRRAARAGARAADDARRARGGEGARRPRGRAPLHRAQRQGRRRRRLHADLRARSRARTRIGSAASSSARTRARGRSPSPARSARRASTGGARSAPSSTRSTRASGR